MPVLLVYSAKLVKKREESYYLKEKYLYTTRQAYKLLIYIGASILVKGPF